MDLVVTRVLNGKLFLQKFLTQESLNDVSLKENMVDSVGYTHHHCNTHVI